MEVVQVYARARGAKVPMPIRQLWAFDRIELEPGEKRVVTFRLTPEKAVARYDETAKRFVVDPGGYEVEAGASSGDIRARGRFTVR